MPTRSQGTIRLEESAAANRREDALFSDETEVGALCRAVDWGATPLGDPAGWPLSLRTTVRIMLSSRFAMWMAWGPELTMLYNDAYARMTLGAKHPWALGKPASTVWAEIWSDIGPRIDRVMETGVATWDEALLLFLERSGYPEETYHTFSYSPLAGDDGSVTGMLCVVSEETDRIIADRRLASLRDLAAGLSSVVDEDDVLHATAAALRANAMDLPFAAVYLLDAEGTAVLGCTSGIDAGAPAAPMTFAAGDAGGWPLGAMLAKGGMLVVDDLGARVGASDGKRSASLPTGAWQTAPTRGVMLPIAQPGGDRPEGLLVAGVNPFRPLDAEFNGFLGLIAGQIGASLANARAREAERRRAEELAELDRAKTQFFSNVSHEFRTPLTLLLAPAEDSLNDATTSPANRERMAIVHRNALRMLRLVNNLLDFSRIEAGRVAARHEATDLGAYTAELASSFRSAMERAGLRLTVDAAPGVEAHIDRELWEKIVLNLLSNAFKHTFTGGVAISVHARGGEAVMELRDTGVGIPAEQLPHIFERFHRVPNARSRTHEGTGIGLALVQELVRLHHGTITVASIPDEGTTFTVTIPRGTAHLRADQLSAPTVADAQARRLAGTTSVAFVEEAARWLTGSSADGTSAATTADEGGTSARGFGPLDGARVLVADDNADMREYVTRLLRDRGCVVTAVADGAAALAAAQREDPELIVSDVMMPGLDGFELIRALRAGADTRGIPVILLSARAGEEARVEGIAAGADDYLVKPFSARELVARVEGRIQLDRTRRETEREREQLLARVESERARLQTVFAQAPAGIAVLEGPRHVFASANSHYQRLVGERPLVGRAIRDALPELAGQGLYELLDEVYRTATPYVGSERRVMIEIGGELREYFFTFVYQPIVDAAGASTGIFIHAVDVTSQVRARQEVEAAKDAAERANRAKSEFLAAMSHELRTPLNAIGGYTQLIELGVHGPLTPEQRNALSRVQRSQQHLLSLINDVLNFAKLEAGRVEYHIEDVDLTAIAASVGPMIEPQLTERGLTYDVQVGRGLMVRADAERLQQIMLNLLSNAVKFTDRGGTITLEARSSARGAELVEILVRDTGIGIAADKLESIFDPFVQAHRNLTRTTEGTGLGLAISRDLAIAMHGELTVESEQGRGSTFTLVLPAA